MAQIIGLGFFREVLEHEISELSRIKRSLNLFEHFPSIDNIAIAYVPTKGQDAVESVKKTIKPFLREADVIFPAKDYTIIMLPGTDEMGAIHVLEGVAEFLGEELSFAYVIYPDHGETAQELIDSLKALVKKKFGTDIDI